MKPYQHLSLAGEAFDQFDLSEAVLNLNYSALSSSVVSVGVWGAVLHMRGNSHLDPVAADAMAPVGDIAYLPDWSMFTFKGVEAVEIEVTPYVPSFQRGGTFGPTDSTSAELSGRWGGQCQSSCVHIYGFDCVLDHPYGYCSLRIMATGDVAFRYRPDLLIPLSVYQSNPEIAGWWGRGRLRT